MLLRLRFVLRPSLLTMEVLEQDGIEESDELHYGPCVIESQSCPEVSALRSDRQIIFVRGTDETLDNEPTNYLFRVNGHTLKSVREGLTYVRKAVLELNGISTDTRGDRYFELIDYTQGDE